MDFTLIAEIGEGDLLMDLIHEYGTTFMQKLGKNRYRVVYFSGKRMIFFEGELNKEQIEKLKNIAYEVSKIQVNMEERVVNIVA